MSKAKEYYFKEGCYIQEWLNTPSHPDMSIARVRVEALQTTRLHRLLKTVERYVILEGNAIVTVGEQARTVSMGDVIIIESEVPQKIQNTENTQLIFLAICTPRFELEHYVDCEV